MKVETWYNKTSGLWGTEEVDEEGNCVGALATGFPTEQEAIAALKSMNEPQFFEVSADGTWTPHELLRVEGVLKEGAVDDWATA